MHSTCQNALGSGRFKIKKKDHHAKSQNAAAKFTNTTVYVFNTPTGHSSLSLEGSLANRPNSFFPYAKQNSSGALCKPRQRRKWILLQGTAEGIPATFSRPVDLTTTSVGRIQSLLKVPRTLSTCRPGADLQQTL